MNLTTHVLDTARGRPASGVTLQLYAITEHARTLLRETITNADGRTDIPLGVDLAAGVYEIVFAAGMYFKRDGVTAFYERVPVQFRITDGDAAYHVPLLLAPWGYSTYRGS